MLLQKSIDTFFENIKPSPNEAEADLFLTSSEVASKIERYCEHEYTLAQIETMLNARGYHHKAIRQGESFEFVWLIEMAP